MRTTGFQQRQERATAAIQAHVCPDVPRWFGVHGTLHCLEGGALDLKSASDWTLLTEHGIYLVAARVQWPTTGRSFDTFTVRTTSHGAHTELPKLREARDLGAVGPDYHLQLYCAGDELLAGASVPTFLLLEMIESGDCRGETNTDDGNGFAIVPWGVFPRHWIRIIRPGQWP